MIGPRLRQGSCRLCLWESNSLWDIFGELAERRNFIRKIQACVNINVSKDDGLSSLICPNCIYKIELFYDFQTSCKRSDEIQKRYNGYQDSEYSDCDAVEDQVHPTPAHHCAISNSHKDAHGPIETIDIKEEPIDDYEVAVGGVDDEQFEDAEVEVVAVEDERLEEGISMTEHHQQTEKDQGKEGEGGGNGSCMQLTPPRSPSVMSEVTYSASESAGSAVSDSPEEVEQQQQQQNGKDGQPESSSGGLDRESGGRSCGHCAECHPDPHTCQDQELSCRCRSGTDDWQRQVEEEEEEAVHPASTGLTEHNAQCRFCKKWFQTVDTCRTHETECAPLHGYAPPQKPGTDRRCRFCSVLFMSEAGRALHEHHCVLRECRGGISPFAAAQTGSNPRCNLPPPSKYIQQCRFCRKYFPRVRERRIHELQCGIQSGYTLSQLQALPAHSAAMNPVGGRRCSICSRVLKTAGGRQRHEHYCRRNSTQVRSHASTPEPQSAARSVSSQTLSHELSCAEVPACSDGLEANPVSLSGGQDVIKCRYCGKGHLKWRSLMTHEFHCRRKVPLRPEVNAEVAARTVEMEANSEVAGGNRDKSDSLEGNAASKNQRQGPHNQCTYCHKWFRTKTTCKVHEYYCSRNVRKKARGRYKCSFCPRKFLKRNTYHMHMRHCCYLPDRTSKSVTVSRVEPTAQRQLPLTGCETALGKDEYNDRQEVISPAVPEPEQTREKVNTPFCTPVSESNKETDIQTCQYCDRIFKYRECLRSHEVTCSAIATYQYNLPYHRSPSFFKCPLCKKAFKFRRKLRNHWKVCRARISVVAEAPELNSDAKLGQTRSVQSEESGAGGAVMPYGDACSPEEDREEWRGWPSSHSPTVVDLVTDEESDAGTADASELSCKLCKKSFCSRVLLELHTLNECVYQRIRNDHAYAQCESSGVDESTLMRMARVELRRLLLCSCCGGIFTDRQALAEHERSERQRRSRMTTGEDHVLQHGPEATHVQKRIKLGKAADELGPQHAGGQQQSSCRLQHQAMSDQVVPAKIIKLADTDSRQDSNKNCLLRDSLCNNDNRQIVRKVACELQAKEEVSIKQQEWQQLGSMSCKLGSNNNSVLRDCVRNDCNLQLKEDLSEKVFSVDNGLKQGRQTEVFNPQYQECPSSDHKL